MKLIKVNEMAKNTLILQIGPTDSFHLCASNMMQKSRNGYFSVILKSFHDGCMQWLFNLWTKKTRGARGWEKLQLLNAFLWKLQWNELLQERERKFGSFLFFLKETMECFIDLIIHYCYCCLFYITRWFLLFILS